MWSLALVIILLLLIIWHSNKKKDKEQPKVTPSIQTVPVATCHGGSRGVRLYPDAFWDDGYTNSPPGFGLSSGEIQFQLPHPQDPQEFIEQKNQWQRIDSDRKCRIGYSTQSCESPADWMTKASGYTSYLWQQPAPIMNYFKPPYPEDDASDRHTNLMTFDNS